MQDGPADTLAPGALLAALTEAAFADAARLGDNELTGALEAARRLQNRAGYLQTLAVAELARRRATQHEQDKAAGVPGNRCRAQFPDLELAAQLLTGRRHAQCLLDEAAELTTRLPLTLAGMAAGLIDAVRASAIASATLCLSDTDAARVDEALAETAHEVRADTVARRAAALAMKLDPEAAQREREDARRTRQRVEARREQSGNASLSIRESDTSVVISVKAAIDELAIRLRNGGAEGTLDSLRAMAALDRLLARDPLDRLAPPPSAPAEDGGYPAPLGDGRCPVPPEDDGYPVHSEDGGHPAPSGDGATGDGHDGHRPGGQAGTDPAASATGTDVGPSHDPGHGNDPGHSGEREVNQAKGISGDEDECASAGGDVGQRARVPADGKDGDPPGHGDGDPARGSARFPALVNLLVPASTLLGWGTAPGQADTWGLTDPEETRDIVQAASLHPRTRWCLTIVNEHGEAIAHACAPGQHLWAPPSPDSHDSAPRDSDSPHPPGSLGPPGARDQSACLQEFLVSLGITPGAVEPIARGACDHRHAEDRYLPSRKLRHLIRARSQACTAPGCGGQSVHADLDHVVPFPDGPSDECNLHSPCRAHHRAKQAPDWQAEMTEPGVLRWTLPSGRTRVTRPTIYDC